MRDYQLEIVNVKVTSLVPFILLCVFVWMYYIIHT